MGCSNSGPGKQSLARSPRLSPSTLEPSRKLISLASKTRASPSFAAPYLLSLTILCIFCPYPALGSPPFSSSAIRPLKNTHPQLSQSQPPSGSHPPRPPANQLLSSLARDHLRAEIVPAPPHITTDHDGSDRLTGSDGIHVSISPPDAPDVLLRFTQDGSSPTCDPPKGTTYSGPFEVCGQETATVIKVVACDKATLAQSSEESVTLDVKPFVPALPSKPTFQTEPSGACEQQGDRFDCTAAQGRETVTLLLSSPDFSCSIPVHGEQQACVSNGGEWQPMPTCSTDNIRPCEDIYYTIDGSDPSVTQGDAVTRKLYAQDSGIEVAPGDFTIRAVTVRRRRQADKRTCKCCCDGESCQLFGTESQVRYMVKDSGVANTRDEHTGSPDIDFTVSTSFEDFQAAYYAQKLQWRTEIGFALGVLHQSLGDWRRIKGDCDCQVEFGCLREEYGSDICFHPVEGGQKTEVTFYITSAGSCVGGLSKDGCVSNSSCGEGYCNLEPISWKAAYGRLQEQDTETGSALEKLSITATKVHQWVDVKAAMDLEKTNSMNVVQVVAVLVLLLLILALCFGCRGKCSSALNAVVPQVKDKGRQVVAKVKAVRDEDRIKRNAKFQKMNDLGGLEPDTVGLEIEEETRTAPWMSKQRGGQAIHPVATFVSAPLSQTTSEGETPAASEVAMPDHETEWGAFEETAFERPSSRREVVASTGELKVELEYDPSAVSYRQSTLEQVLFFTNAGDDEVTGFTCKAAVPKYMQVQIAPPSSSTMPVSGEATQTLRLTGVDKSKPIKIRLKIEYQTSAGNKAETVDINLGDLAQR